MSKCSLKYLILNRSHVESTKFIEEFLMTIEWNETEHTKLEHYSSMSNTQMVGSAHFDVIDAQILLVWHSLETKDER